MNWLRIAAALCGVISLATTSSAQTAYPNRSVKIVVPFAAGGGVDSFARLFAQKLQDKTGQIVVVENRGGGNGTIGGNAVVQSPADGYTLLFSASTNITPKLVMKSPPYDPLTDMTPIARVGEAPMLLVIPPNSPANTLQDVIAAARRNPNEWTASTAALGAPGHLATIAFSTQTKLNLTITTYRGTAPALNDVAGGHVQLLFDAIPALAPMAKAGKVKAVAVTSTKRNPLAPEVPTTAESGLPEVNIVSWYGFWGPKGMPPQLVAEMNRLLNSLGQELDKEGKLAALGILPIAGTPEEFSAFIAQEFKRSEQLLKAANFQPE